MNAKEKRQFLRKMLKQCPDVLRPQEAAKWSPVGKNTIYAAIKTGQLKVFVYRGSYIFSKDALIEFLIETSDKPSRVSALTRSRKSKSPLTDVTETECSDTSTVGVEDE